MSDPAQRLKAERFRELHQRPDVFVVPNPWDAGSARILAALGFEALATTSAGLAFSLGLRDAEGALTRDQALVNAEAIVAATPLPVSADLENGFADAPEEVAATIRLAAATGLVGGSIEDATGNPNRPIYDFALAVERIAAAVEAAHSLPFPFTLTARAENFLHGQPDLDDTIRRLQAFEDVGADVLYAPGLRDRGDIATLCRSVGKPVNVVMGLQGGNLTLAELAELGVRRVSVGSALARAALARLVRGAEEIRKHGTFTFADDALSFAEVNGFMAGAPAPGPAPRS